MKQGRLVPQQVPLRVDFAGGWLDVPKLARPGAFIVNCAIQPLVSLTSWPYEIGAGLGGSAAKAILEGRDGVASEIATGVGWQDPAVIRETGLCVWRSGARPLLETKSDPAMLVGRMALLWTGKTHNTPGLVDRPRDYDLIEKAGALAAKAVARMAEEIRNSNTEIRNKHEIQSPKHETNGEDGTRQAKRGEPPAVSNFGLGASDLFRISDFGFRASTRPYDALCDAVAMSYEMQRKEGMPALPDHGEQAKKYCGGGFGGYAVYLYADAEARKRALDTIAGMRVIDPYAANG